MTDVNCTCTMAVTSLLRVHFESQSNLLKLGRATWQVAEWPRQPDHTMVCPDGIRAAESRDAVMDAFACCKLR